MSTPAVMIVEDERIVALHLHDQLVKLGYDVLGTFASGSEALERCAVVDPDVVLMDIRIEGEIDGIVTASRMAESRNAAVIYLTSHAEDETIARARDTRPFGYLIKPFSERELHATIQIALRRRADELALRASEQRQRLALDAAEMGSWQLDPAADRMEWDRRADLIVGCGQRPTSRHSRSLVMRHVHPHDRALVDTLLEDVDDEESLRRVDFRGRPRGGVSRRYRAQAKRFSEPESGSRRIIGVVQDVTAAHADELSLREAASVFDATREGILVLDRDFRVTAANPGYCRITGLSPDEVLGRRPPPLEADGASGSASRDAIDALGAGDFWHGELDGHRKNGEALVVTMDLVAVRDETGEFLHHVAVLTDITALRKAEDELRHLAHHDSLTGLGNRALALDRLHHGLERCRRHGERLALLLIDLDRFKQVNDTYGHEVGDELLRTIAKRLVDSTRAEDTVARLGGDEFLLIIESVWESSEVGALADKIVNLVAEPIVVDGVALDVGASIGISLFPQDADDGEALIRTADTALYETKESGRNGYTFHSSDMRDRAFHQLSLEQDLRRAMANHELRLYFQPQIELSSGRIVGAEALLRRLTADGDLLGPETIVPLAERGGLIVEIGDWVIHEACRQALVWESAGAPRIRIAVNVSALQLQHNALLHTFGKLAEMPHVHRDLIELEITESALQTEERSLRAVQELERMGASFAIDDFGTGYSNLSSLKHLPLNRLKIDKSLVRDVPEDASDVAIIEAIVAMSRRLRLRLVAEGVECRAQHEFLLDSGCEEAQGYYYAKPMPPEELLALLLRDEPLVEPGGNRPAGG